MKKNRILAVLICLLTVTVLGCQKTEEASVNALEKIENQLEQMKSYSCKATMRRISNKGENTYETVQSYQSTGEYKLELTAPENVAGNYTVFDGKQICQFNPRVGGKVIVDVPESKQRNELFLGAFASNYKQMPKNSEEENYVVLEATIPEGNQYIATEKLWVDKSTGAPAKFVIYDKNGQERYVVEYKEFEFDTEFAPDFFKIPE